MHGAHQRRRRQADPAPSELSVQETHIERDVMSDQDAAVQHLPQRRRSLRKGWSVEDVLRADAVDPGRAHITSRVDQRAELRRDLPLGADVHDRDLNDTVSAGIKPGGLDINDSEARTCGRLPEKHFRRLSH